MLRQDYTVWAYIKVTLRDAVHLLLRAVTV